MIRTRIVAVAASAMTAILLGAACKKAPPAAPAPTVLVAEVIQKDCPIYSEWVGTTVGFVNAQIRPRVQGYLLKQNYKDGAAVTKGQLLFQIDDRDYKAALDQALGNLAQQQANLKKNQLDLARYKPLAAEGAVSRQEYDNSLQATRASQAEVESARAAVENAKLNVGWTQIFSPIDGVAGIAPVQVGDLVTPSTLLTSISQLDPIKVNFPISEQEYLRAADRIKEHQRTGTSKDEPDLELILGDGSIYKYPGHFYVVNRAIDIETGTIGVQGIFPNPDSLLRPGQYAKVRAATQIRRQALLVPQRAVQETQGQYQVAVVNSDNVVSLHNVKPGDRMGSLWIITEGVNPGEHVVVEGLQKVKDGIEVIPKTVAEPAGSSSPAPAGPSGTSSGAAAAPRGYHKTSV